jgi:hypothetical protein
VIRPLSSVSKFRPVDPVVYPAVASKLGLLNPEAVFPILQFYFRLDALRREIDVLLTDEIYDSETKFAKVRRRLRLITTRFREALQPGRLALEKLNVVDAARVEDAAARAYPNVAKLDRSLRQQLREHEG